MKKGEQRDKMTAIKFKVKCPYEIGDKVKFEKAGKIHVMEITDILLETSIKHERHKFILELDGWYQLDTEMHEVRFM